MGTTIKPEEVVGSMNANTVVLFKRVPRKGICVDEYGHHVAYLPWLASTTGGDRREGCTGVMGHAYMGWW